MSNNEKQCFEVYNWIQQRYEYYDDKQDKYSADEYTEQVFIDASKHFNLTLDRINKLYNDYSYTFALAKNFKNKMEKVKRDPDALKVFKLNNKTVKLNTNKILKDKTRNNPRFTQFIKDNKDTVFTAITDESINTMYTLKEDHRWLFYEDDLIENKH